MNSWRPAIDEISLIWLPWHYFSGKQFARLSTDLCMKGSVEIAAMESPSANAVALQGSVNLNVKRHSPVATSQSFALLSAEAVNSREESTAE